MLHFGEAQQNTAAQPGFLTTGAGTIVLPDGFTQTNTWIQSGSTGVTYGSQVATTGGPTTYKQIAAGTPTWDVALSADQASYPSPFPNDDYTNMDRVAMSTFNHQPWDDLVFSFMMPNALVGAQQTIATLYYSGPAACTIGDALSRDPGLGQYACKFTGDGNANVYELTTTKNWAHRFEFSWDDNAATPARWCVIRVHSDCTQDVDGNFYGGKTTFIVGQSPKGFSDLVLVARNFGNIQQRDQNYPVYYPAHVQNNMTTVAPIRIDAARDVRVDFQIARHIYPASGYLLDDFVAFDFPITPDVPFLLGWSWIAPTGTSMTAAVFDENGNPLTPGAVFQVTGGSYQYFTPTALMRYAQVKLSFTASTDQAKSPVLTRWLLNRLPDYVFTSPVTPIDIPIWPVTGSPQLPQTTIDSAQIIPQQADPTGETANILVHDLTGNLPSLVTGTMRPYWMYAQIPMTSMGNIADISSGYVHEANADPVRFDPLRNYPGPGWRELALSCVGEWGRLQEAVLPFIKPWQDAKTKEPYKVTDMVRVLWEGSYPPSMVDVPDNPIELFTDAQDAYVSKPGTRVLDLTTQLLYDYIGGYPRWERSAGTYGMWRALQPKHSPYNNLAVFTIQSASQIANDGIPRLNAYLPAYPMFTVSGQEVQYAPIFAETMRTKVIRAEGNMVQLIAPAAGAGNASKLTANDLGLCSNVAIDVTSYNFLNLPSTAPGYPDGSSPSFMGRIVPIRAIDPLVGNQAGANWKTRRIYDRCCYPRSVLTFQAPVLFVIDATDSLQRMPRLLKYYDAVLVQDQYGDFYQYLVLSCSPMYEKDGVMLANYQLVTSSNINTIGVMPTPYSQYYSFQKALWRFFGYATGSPPPSQTTTIDVYDHWEEIATLGTVPSNFLQDLDNTSPTFGQFINMPGMDAAAATVLRA
jgi:hypothetical protein